MTVVTLTPEIEAWAEAEIEAGRAESVASVVTKAMELRRAELGWLRGKLDEARAPYARGEFIEEEEFFVEIDRWIAEDEGAADAA